MSIKKVVLVIPKNVSGGAERVMIKIANYFALNDIDVSLINFDKNTKFYDVDEKVRYIKMNLEFKFKNKFLKILQMPQIEFKRFRFIRKELKKIRPDIVIPFLKTAELLTIPNCINLDIPFCVSLRNDYNEYNIFMKAFVKYTYKRANLVVLQTEQVKEELQKIVKCNAVVIENPLDEQTYSKDIFVGSRRKVIVNVGRLIEQKNQTMLIKAFSKISKEFPEYELHIFGDGKLKKELVQLIDSLKLNEKVFLKGVVPNVLLNNNDVSLFVMSSDFEGFPNALVEAMANGIPVISTDFATNAANQLLKSGECGKLVQVGNVEQLADAIKEVLSNEEKFSEKAQKALYVREKLDSIKICRKWIDELNKTIS